MEFQTKIQRLLGQESKEEKLRNYITSVIQRDKLTGYKEADICDPKYTVLENYAREHLPNDSGVKVYMCNVYVLSIFSFIHSSSRICRI